MNINDIEAFMQMPKKTHVKSAKKLEKNKIKKSTRLTILALLF